MNQIVSIIIVVLLTFSYKIIKRIVTKMTQTLGNIDIDRYFIYIWGAIAFSVALLIEDNIIYQLPVVDKRVIIVCLAVLIANIFISKYSGYKPLGRYNMINFVVFYPIFEEVIFRGLILPILNKSFQYAFIEIAFLPVTISVIISAFLFSIAHLQYYKFNKLSMRYMFFAFIGGILFGAIADYTQSIFIPVLLHIEFNLLSACYSIKNPKV